MPYICQTNYTQCITWQIYGILWATIKRSLPSPNLLTLHCERFMMLSYSLLLSVFDGLQEAARHVCQRMESMATSRMMKADSGRMYHGKEMA